MWKLVILWLALACSSAPKQTPVVEPKPEPKLDPVCGAWNEIELADGKLRCRELPLVVDFPPNTKLKREDSNNLSFITAQLDRGVLGILIEPRFDIDDDQSGYRARIDGIVRTIAPDAVIVDGTAPPQPGATITTANSFTTPDGGTGLIRAYAAHGWFVAIMAGGRKAETGARPDSPAGKAFLESFQLRAPAPGWETLTLFNDVKLDIPLGAWELREVQTSMELGKKSYVWPAERVFFAVKELQSSPSCALFENFEDADVVDMVRTMFGKPDLEVPVAKFVKIATKTMHASFDTINGQMALYLVCDKSRVFMFTATARRPYAELTTVLDRVTKSFPR